MEIKFLLLECVDCVRILGKLVIIGIFTCALINGVDDTIDFIIGLPTMIYNPIGNLLVAAKSNNIKADPFDKFLREVGDCEFLGVFWFREVDEERVRDFRHAE